MNPGNINNEIRCPYCDTTIKHLYNLKRHLVTNHFDKEKKFTCIHAGCNAKFVNKANMSRHFLHQHLNTTGRPYECQQCSKKFKQYAHLKRHNTVHTKERNFACRLCPKVYAYPTSLWKHEKVHHSEIKNIVTSEGKMNNEIRCPYPRCGTMIKHLYNLKRHLFTIHFDKEKKFPCRQVGCNSKFVNKAHLKRHNTVHTKERNFACRLCPKVYAYPTSLWKHEKVHHKLHLRGRREKNGRRTRR